MFDNKNHYTLRTEVVGGDLHYYVSFADGEGVYHATEVSRPVYMLFLRFIKDERNLKRWDERHVEYIELTDEVMFARAMFPPKSLEEATIDCIQDEYLWLVIRSLSSTQRRRLLLHYKHGLTYEEISKREGCSKASAFRSVNRAVEKIREKIKFFEI
jgi:RNA polymerase sigma-70 factor (ECF subfamily)